MGTETLIHALEQYVQAKIKYHADLDHGHAAHIETSKKKLDKTKVRLAEAISSTISHEVDEKLRGIGYHRE